MSTPDFSRGGGFGNPELKADMLGEHQREAAEAIKADHDAKLALEAAHHVPWYRRLFRRS